MKCIYFVSPRKVHYNSRIRFVSISWAGTQHNPTQCTTASTFHILCYPIPSRRWTYHRDNLWRKRGFDDDDNDDYNTRNLYMMIKYISFEEKHLKCIWLCDKIQYEIQNWHIRKSCWEFIITKFRINIKVLEINIWII